MLQGCWLLSCDKNQYCSPLKSHQISSIIQAIFSCSKIQNKNLHNHHTQRPIAATVPFPKSSTSTSNLNILKSQYNFSCINLTDVIIQSIIYQNEMHNLSRKLHLTAHLSTFQSARKVPTHDAIPWKTVQPVHSIITLPNLLLGSCCYTSNWRKRLQWKDL